MSVNQDQNVAAGHIAGRDIHQHTTYAANPPSTLRELAARLRIESEEEPHPGFIDELKHFAESRSDQPGRNLEQKLEDGSRTDLLADAVVWKEQFAKKLLRLQFSEQAQELFAHILSKIHTFFVYQVRPKVLEDTARSEVDTLIYGLINELYEEVGTSELDLTMNDLQGMVYFLAGNCHIDWG